ncbi:MAG: hypothetical protein BGP04_01950 [Rhizobiales bacterium 62-17]|nr:SOS response-associated peptidase family protein [Hyphomicrobiales bacterium]OJY04204.1 MAG: hypothetical protein BGP04_01950 [Rhizobiales bacterium 62-17]
MTVSVVAGLLSAQSCVAVVPLPGPRVRWKKPLKEMKMSTFNAKAEDVDSKPTFREAFKKRRCIIPASGFFEWTRPKADRTPHSLRSLFSRNETFPQHQENRPILFHVDRDDGRYKIRGF